MSAAAQIRTRRPPGTATLAALLSLGLHLGLVVGGVFWGRSEPGETASATGSPESEQLVALPIDLSGEPNPPPAEAAPAEPVRVEASPPESARGEAKSEVRPPVAAKPMRAPKNPEPKVAAARAPLPQADPEGEDWLGLQRPDAGPEPKPKAPPTATKGHHEQLVERLLAAEERKAAARASEQTNQALAAQRSPPVAAPTSQVAAADSALPAADAAATPTARRIQAANSLSQAAAWTIPYACATDPVWERQSAVSGLVELRVQLASGRVKATQLQGEVPTHLKKLADGVTFYLKQGYRGGEGLAADGAYVLRIVVRTSEGPKNQSLGFDPDRARSHFTLITGRRVDAEVTEQRPAR